MNKEKQRGIRIVKSLQELSEVVPVTKMQWPTIQKLIADSKTCARKKSWPVGDFMFCHQGSKKYINEKTTPGAFYEPITMQFLQKHKLKGFTVQNHFNRWRHKTAILQVGFFPNGDDRDGDDWEIYTP